MPKQRSVSIPIGFSQALQRYQPACGETTTKSFNPYRVFSGLATCQFQVRVLNHVRVSIPIGFSQALQQTFRYYVAAGIGSFNPYRVFSGLATAKATGSVLVWQSFNPYRVFSGLATQGQDLVDVCHRFVSIPIGFSQALQLGYRYTYI